MAAAIGEGAQRLQQVGLVLAGDDGEGGAVAPWPSRLWQRAQSASTSAGGVPSPPMPALEPGGCRGASVP
ncbi:hypothetical protein ACFQU7_17410 [Pseudoroseomonas wenyumeiae]